jgi:hypothetical protein
MGLCGGGLRTKRRASSNCSPSRPKKESSWLGFRHSDPKLAAREEKDRPLVWLLIRSGSREAVFEGPEASGQGTTRLTYRQPDEDTLFSYRSGKSSDSTQPFPKYLK